MSSPEVLPRIRERIEEVRTRVRARVEEVRTRARARVEEIRARLGVRPILGGEKGRSPEIPTVKEVLEKGVLGVLEERFPRIKEIREKRILEKPSKGITEVGAPTTPPRRRPKLKFE